MAKTGRLSFQFMLRLTEDLRDRLREISEANNRSMNAEIVLRLEASFQEHPAETMLEDAGYRTTRMAEEFEAMLADARDRNKLLSMLVAQNVAVNEMLARHIMKDDPDAREVLNGLKSYADSIREISAELNPADGAPEVPPDPPAKNKG